MITFVATQLLHLKLDEIAGGKAIDSSGKGNDGTVQGTAQIVPDDTLGGCLSLSGSAEYINLLPGCIPVGNEITVSFWAYGRDALSKNSVIIEAIDTKNLITFSVRLPSGDDSTIYFSCGNDGSIVDSIAKAAQPADFKGAWTYWAFTKSATSGEMNIYRNGVLWLSGTGKTRLLPTTTMVKLGATADGTNCYVGKIAHVRVYNQVLALAAITHDMEVDQTALASFRKSYPIDFHLYNDDEQEVLNITDDPAGQNLHLEVSNASGQAINLIAPDNSIASASNYHFALRFRPDVLSIVSQSYTSFAASLGAASAAQAPQPHENLAQLFQSFIAPQSTQQSSAVPGAVQSFLSTMSQGAQQLGISSAVKAFAIDTAVKLQGSLHSQGWNIGYGQEPDGTVVIYFLSVQARVLPAGAKIAVTLPHVSAGAAAGARGTRVELLYQQLTFGNDISPISGRRQVYLSIVNQRGQRAVPLHVNFVGFNTILNDGQTPNTLILHITNSLRDSIIALNPEGSSAPSKFIFSFDVQTDDTERDWVLGKVDLVSNINVTVNSSDAENWNLVKSSSADQTPEWVLTPKQSKAVRGAEEMVQLTLANIIVSPPFPGQTNLYIRYENIPGYWDGQFVLSIEKTPLVYSGNNVGIGTIAPSAKLTISAPGQPPSRPNSQQPPLLPSSQSQQLSPPSPPSPQHLQLRRETTETNGDKILFLELYQSDEPNSLKVPEVHPCIRFHHQSRFWQRIEGSRSGIHFKTGDLDADSYTDIFANTGHFSNIGIDLDGSLQQGIKFLPGGGALTVNTSDVLLWAQGHVTINGTLSTTTKLFCIDHPSKPDHSLIHGCLEGPEAGVYYRGHAQLADGKATIHLPDYFEALTRQEGRTVLLTPEGREPFLLSYESIVDGTFTVYGTKVDGAFSWEVKAVRADVGRLEVEVKK